MIDHPHIKFSYQESLAPFLILLTVLVVTFFYSVGIASAADTPITDTTGKIDPIRIAVVVTKIEQRITELEQQQESDTQKAELVLLRQALQFLEQRKKIIELAAHFEQQTTSAPGRIAAIEHELSLPLPDPQLIMAEDASGNELHQRFDDARIQLDVERKVRDDVEQLATYSAHRRESIPAEIADTRLRLAEVNENLLILLETPALSYVDKAKNMALKAENVFLDEKLIALDQEIRNHDTERDLIRARKQLAERKVVLAEQQVDLLENAVTAKRNYQVEQARRQVEQQRRILVNSHPIMQAIAKQNESLVAEFIQGTEKSTQAREQLQQIENELARLSKDFISVQEKLTKVGFNDAIGIRLRKLRVNFPDLVRHRRALVARNDELNSIQFRRVELEDALLATVDIDAEIDRRFSEYNDLDAEKNSDLRVELQQALLEQKNQYLLPLAEFYDVYFDDVLEQLHENERLLINTGEDFSNFISEFILWVQSTHPINVTDLAQTWRALYWLINPSSWLQLFEKIKNDVASHRLYSITLIFLIVILFSLQRKMLRMLDEAAVQAKKKFKARFHHTLSAALLTLILAGIWPLILWVVSYQLNQLKDFEFSAAISDGFLRVALLLFVGQILLHMVKKNGLAEAHFHWPQQNIDLIKRHLSWLLPVVIPFGFVIIVLEYQSVEAHRDSLGRFAFMIVMFIVSVFLYKLMNPKTGVFANVLSTQRDGWLDKLKVIWFPAAVAVPIIFAIMAGWGYMFTAVKLEQEVIYTVMLILGAIVSRDFIMRWLELEQRKMALGQARIKFTARLKAREEVRAASEDSVDNKTTITSEVALDEQLIDVDTVSAQTKKLVQSFFFFSIILGIFFAWKDVFPAFGLLNDVDLWQQTVNVTIDQGSENKTGAGDVVQQVVSITLGDVILSIFFVVATLIVSRNIPGLMEIVVLRHLPFSPGGRYAATTLTRYVIIIVGVLLAFEAIGVGWSKVQWLAAAVTVGLGFGLQEIFANFVSGLIILFERPIRVGDAVTVGGISGRVARIQMRATTITDWDRKELIIPNKEFITGQVVNWSLTDTIVRIPIEIGIAYGSDTELATKLLLDVASLNSEVLNDPEPTAYFTGFGDSTLNFSLRVFVDDPDEVYPVRHDILTNIDHVFRKHGIEIAFPQRDLHIRSADAMLVQNAISEGSVSNTKTS